MSRYIVREPVIVNGKRRQRGDILEGADAQAVDGSVLLQHRCIRDSAPSAAPTPVPSSFPAGKAASVSDGGKE